MNIVIGAPPIIGDAKKSIKERCEGLIEAKILDIRQSRKPARIPPSGEKDRRSASHVSDPLGGRVVTLLIPEGHRIPDNLTKGNFRIFVRFQPVRQKSNQPAN
jgi:hypothetical protein